MFKSFVTSTGVRDKRLVSPWTPGRQRPFICPSICKGTRFKSNHIASAALSGYNIVCPIASRPKRPLGTPFPSIQAYRAGAAEAAHKGECQFGCQQGGGRHYLKYRTSGWSGLPFSALKCKCGNDSHDQLSRNPGHKFSRWDGPVPYGLR